MNFNSLNLQLPSTTVQAELQNGSKINVKQYLPISDKIDLIEIAIQKATENGVINDIKLDTYFHLNVMYLYTDIEFSDEDKEDELALFDLLDSNHVITSVILAMNEDEYKCLIDYLEQEKKNIMKYKNSAAGVLRGIIQDLPTSAAAAKEILDTFDPERFKQVINFATAANGGRNINTNTVPVPASANQSELKLVNPEA